MSGLAVTDVYISHGSGEDHWIYNCPDLNVATVQLGCNVTDPQGNETSYTGTGFSANRDALTYGASPTFQETSRQIYSGGTLIRTVNTTYGGSGGAITLPATVTTTLNDAASGIPNQQQIKFSYDQYDNVIEKDESDFYTGGMGVCAPPGWLRKTLTTYYWAQYPAYQTAHIVDKPYTITVTDGIGNPVSETQYGYDEFALSGNAGIQNHDDGVFPVSFQGPRGNMTTEKHCIAFSGTACAGWATTTNRYDLTGQVVSATDPCGNSACSDVSGSSHITTYSYVDNYLNYTPVHPTNGFPMTITRPQTGANAHVDKYSYYYNTGGVYQHTDENLQVTSYSYTNLATGNADSFNRIGQITFPLTGDGPAGAIASGYLSYTYSDVANAFSVTLTSLMSTKNSQVLTKVTNFDSLGRLENIQRTVPEGTAETDTTYDTDGHVYSVTTPYLSLSDPTYGLTTYPIYDALGRKETQTNPDNTSETWKYAGSTTTFTDGNQNQWQRVTDGLGRLTTVWEPNGATHAPTMETFYTYDALGDLLSVNQCGGTCPSTSVVLRSFSYDSLSRLIQSFNPETGWSCYGTTGGAVPNGSNCLSGYDANGNLQYKTDSRKVVTSYSFDALNRLLSKSYIYDSSSTPSSCYQYDSGSVANSSGRLTAQWTQSASSGACAAAPPSSGIWTRRSILAYDALGRILSEQQCTPSNCVGGVSYAPTYSYDLTGNPYSITNGITTTPTVSTLTFTNIFDSAGRLQKVTSNWNDAVHPPTLFSAQTSSSAACSQSVSTPTYAAFGGLMNAVLGNGLTFSRSYDKRLRVNCETDTGGLVVSPTNGSATVMITGSEQTK